MILRVLALLSLALLAAGVVLVLTGGVLPGILILILALGLGTILGAIVAALRIRTAVREWLSLGSGGGPESVRIVRIEPPRGFIFNREASITLEIRGQDGTTKQVQRGITVPIPQAFMWSVLGRVPLPFAKLTKARDLNVPLYRKRSAKPSPG
jgi:hypothetical protein